LTLTELCCAGEDVAARPQDSYPAAQLPPAVAAQGRASRSLPARGTAGGARCRGDRLQVTRAEGPAGAVQHAPGARAACSLLHPVGQPAPHADQQTDHCGLAAGAAHAGCHALSTALSGMAWGSPAMAVGEARWPQAVENAGQRQEQPAPTRGLPAAPDTVQRVAVAAPPHPHGDSRFVTASRCQPHGAAQTLAVSQQGVPAGVQPGRNELLVPEPRQQPASRWGAFQACERTAAGAILAPVQGLPSSAQQAWLAGSHGCEGVRGRAGSEHDCPERLPRSLVAVQTSRWAGAGACAHGLSDAALTTAVD